MPWRETLFWRSWLLPGFLRLTAKAQRRQREIAKQAKRQCHSCLAPSEASPCCFGCKSAPSIKVLTNSVLFERMNEDMDKDLNMGSILSDETIEQAGARLFDAILEVASGVIAITSHCDLQHGSAAI